MPIYEFRCEKCGHEFERLQKIADPDPEQCPACGKDAVSRLISAAAFRLKGGGWYETDFKKSNRRNVAESGGSGEGNKKDKADKSAKSSGESAGKGGGSQSAGSGKTGGEAA